MVIKDDFILKTFTLMWDFLPLNEYNNRIIGVHIKRDGGHLFRKLWNVSPHQFRRYVVNNRNLVLCRTFDDNCYSEIECIMPTLSVDERLIVMFSRYEVHDCESGMFLVWFASGHLELAKKYSETCGLSETDLKSLWRKELNYFANELNFKIVIQSDDAGFVIVRKYLHWTDTTLAEVESLSRIIQRLQGYDNFLIFL